MRVLTSNIGCLQVVMNKLLIDGHLKTSFPVSISSELFASQSHADPMVADRC